MNEKIMEDEVLLNNILLALVVKRKKNQKNLKRM